MQWARLIFAVSEFLGLEVEVWGYLHVGRTMGLESTVKLAKLQKRCLQGSDSWCTRPFGLSKYYVV